jgi:putative FmdB family regulatory protein
MTYEYACEACGHQWEAEQSIKDPALKKCASCGKNKAKRLVSGGTGFLLKGGGWYADGYGSRAATTSSSSDAGAKGSSGTSSEPASKSDSAGESKPSTESKPAASSETKAASTEPAAKATPVAPPPSKKAS